MAVTAEVRVYSAEYCDKTFARKGEAGGGAAPAPAGPRIIVLGKNDPVPEGTPAGTVIVRKEQ
uniref:C2H2 type zinc-finger protein n=1 Tax=Siphoviridae sp. ctq8D8 TaxID=2827944 RepID=A0A8S5SMJ2_9CAUD|nr:MAG TPA: C2H2 type zinc-finger protein [Siphoviridae sp. ctq8D8]